ncbi:class I SAM-dependent methyltransferase [Tomitella cavernea]|uniref:Methyltransferase domain-containing protein n=1 Tax=Tomitella cavernea TaxID=1387982 RepID=A0ABP9CVS9_9ACTN|nr:class I SAM-dependent methyltransferase [Tomitella cavernea]
MVSLYSLMYGIGYTPWEGEADYGPLPEALAARPPGRALDVGCGTGRHSVLMAERGWQVVGVDYVAKALSRARARAEQDGVADRVRFVSADVARLDQVLSGEVFDLVTDVGCLHGLPAASRNTYSEWLTGHTSAGGELVVAAAQPRRGPGPKGISGDGLAALLGPAWTMVSAEAAPTDTGKGPLRDAEFWWYRMRRTR